jgi:hypothetical protein
MGILEDLLNEAGGILDPNGNKVPPGTRPPIGSTGIFPGGQLGQYTETGKDTGIWFDPDTNKHIVPGSGGSSGGCFITTAVCQTLKRSDDCAELTRFRDFRDTFMQETPEMKAEVREYYDIAPRICSAIDNVGESFANKKYSEIWESSLKPAFDALKHGDKQKAHDIYKGMVLGLKKEFIPLEV